MDYIERGQAVLEIEIAQLQRLAERLDCHFGEAVEALNSALQNGKKIVVIGVGKSQNIGKKFVATLNSTGATAVSLSCQNALHGDLGLISNEDMIVALSDSGETAELISLLPHVKKRASQIIAITGNQNSHLAKHSDLILLTHVSEEACPLRLAPTSSSTNMLALTDALAMVLLEKRGFQPEDFAELHPGGSLGKYLLTRVADIMRKEDEVAKVSPGDTVQDSILAMVKSRSGAAIVINPDDSLAGIFTHGDFVRGYQIDRNIGDQCVANYMTTSPITVRETALAAEVIKILRENRIDDVIVLNNEDKAVGMIDVQDLSRLGLS